MKIRQMVKVEGLRRRLAREKFYHPTILTPCPSPMNGEGGKREFRQVIPRPDVVFILGYQAGNHPLAWGMEKSNGDDRAWERVNEEIRKSNERVRESFYNRRREGMSHVG